MSPNICVMFTAEDQKISLLETRSSTQTSKCISSVSLNNCSDFQEKLFTNFRARRKKNTIFFLYTKPKGLKINPGGWQMIGQKDTVGFVHISHTKAIS